MKQYHDLIRRILTDGKWVYNARTKTRCLTIISHNLQYDASTGEIPILTTRKINYRSAIAELLGYLYGYDNAHQFRELGTNTWNMNANENEGWLNNPARIGEDDLGRIYGVQGRDWRRPDGSSLDQLKKVITNLSKGIDDRGEILSFWNPGEFHLGCLRPCMYEHQFSILDGVLHLDSTQRSCDVPLGLAFNMIQCVALLRLVAYITGLSAGTVNHKIVNAHIYSNQVNDMKTLLDRTILPAPTLALNPRVTIKGLLEDQSITPDDFTIEDYIAHPPIKIPFTV